MSSWLSLVRGVIVIAVLALLPALSQAQVYPNKTIKIISPFDPGGQSDLTARLFADMAKEILKVAVIVENRPGGGGAVGLAAVARAAPDGYTLAQYSSTPMVIRPIVSTVAYDPVKGFTHLGRVLVLSSPLAVKTDSPFKTLDDLLKWAKANPGKLRWAAGAVTGPAHLSTEALFKSAGVETTFIPTSGGQETILQLLGGQYEAASMTNYVQPFQAKQIRLLAESGPVRVPGAPEVKTYKELGYPLALSVYIGFVAPAGLPADVAKIWGDVIEKIVNSDRFQTFLQAQNASKYYLAGPAYAAELANEIATTRSVLQKYGMAK